jgi:hypothetical protein
MLAMLAALTTMGTAANATTLAAAGYGGITQNTADCILYNAGTSKVSVSGAKIASVFSGSLPLTFNNCASLAAGAFCTVQANIVNNNISHACQVDVSSSLDVRGSLVIRNVDPKFGVDQVLIDVPLR